MPNFQFQFYFIIMGLNSACVHFWCLRFHPSFSTVFSKCLTCTMAWATWFVWTLAVKVRTRGAPKFCSNLPYRCHYTLLDCIKRRKKGGAGLHAAFAGIANDSLMTNFTFIHGRRALMPIVFIIVRMLQYNRAPPEQLECFLWPALFILLRFVWQRKKGHCQSPESPTCVLVCLLSPHLYICAPASILWCTDTRLCRLGVHTAVFSWPPARKEQRLDIMNHLAQQHVLLRKGVFAATSVCGSPAMIMLHNKWLCCIHRYTVTNFNFQLCGLACVTFFFSLYRNGHTCI